MASSGWQAWNGLYTSSFGYDYFKCSIRIDSITHSGNTATISGAFGVKNEGSYTAHYDYPITARIRDVTNYQQVVSGGYNISPGGIVDSGVSFSLSVPASDTTASFTIDWVYNNGYANNVYTYTVNFDPSYSAPTGLTVSIAEKYTDGAKFNVSVSSYGNPSSASGRYIEAAILGTSSYGSPYRFSTASNTSSSTITVKNSGSGSLTVQPNTRYYYGAYAGNTQLSTSKVQGQFVTLAPSPTVTVGSVSGNSATINYSTVADGGVYDKTIQYSTDGGTTWQTGVTVTGGSAQTGSFTIDNLPSGENTVLVRTNTTSGADSSVSITVEIEKIVKFYGPVRRYKVVSGYTSKVIENMFSGFTAEGFMQYYEEKYGVMYGVPDHITVNHEAEDGSTTTGKCIWIYFDNGTRKFCTEVTASIVTDLNIWGMNFPGSEGSLTPDADTVTLKSIYYDGYKSKKVKKLYGSVNGQTKRIVKMYGSVNGKTTLVFKDES